MKPLTWTSVGLLALAAATPVAGQRQELTRAAAEQVAAFYNAPSTSRVVGAAHVASGTDVDGDLAALGGPVDVAGTVNGRVLVINGDIRLAPGGRITGGLTVVGGSVTGPTEGVGGTIVVYEGTLRFRREADRIVALEPAGRSLLSQATSFGRGGLNLTVDGAYNRVEGLPIAFGPRFELGHGNPTVFDARIIYRTGNGLQFHPDEMGHDVRVEQYLGGYRSFMVGVGWHRLTDPIENRGISDVENSLSTFILHRDLRDHYVRNGWRVYFQYAARTRPVEAGLEYRAEHHSSIGARTPWSLLDNDEEWRAQPQVADGDINLARGWIRWDSRNDPVDPSAGWFLEALVEQGTEGTIPNAEFTSVSLEARRYLRIGPRSRLALRAMAAGSPDDGPLPAQRQHVLGGEGSLPGYTQFAFDCGAREAPLAGTLIPYYGCDRVVLFQAEYRFAFMGSRGISLGRSLGLDFEIATTPELVLFADGGRAWIENQAMPGTGRIDTGPGDLRYDAGVGVRVGRIGLYLATPLSEGGEGVNFFIRLGPRI